MNRLSIKGIGIALVLGIAVLLSRSARAQEDEGSGFNFEASAQGEAEAETTVAESSSTDSAAEEDSSAVSSLYVDDEIPDKRSEEEEKTVRTGFEAKPKDVQGTWTDEIVFSTDDGSFSFRPMGWLKPRFGLSINPDAEDELEGSGFAFNGASLGFEAKLFDLVNLYLDAGFEHGSAMLVDYYADLDPFDGLAVLRVGFFLPWYGRQLLMEPTRLQMVENAQAWEDEMLGLDLGRDLGASIHGMVADGFEYGLGVWNGERIFGLERDPDNRWPGNIDFMAGGRIAVHPLSLSGMGDPLPIDDESDVYISEKPALVLGAAAYYNKRHDLEVDIPGQTEPQNYYDNQFKFGADLAFRWMGASLQSEFFLLYNKVQDDMDDAIKAAVTAADHSGLALEGVGFGAYVQAGYFVLPRQLEIAARFDTLDEDTDLRGQRFYPGLGATYYIHGHNLKTQLMYRLGVGTGYEETDLGNIPTTHDVFLMLQVAI